jgi:hypothetical protein
MLEGYSESHIWNLGGKLRLDLFFRYLHNPVVKGSKTEYAKLVYWNVVKTSWKECMIQIPPGGDGNFKRLIYRKVFRSL